MTEPARSLIAAASPQKEPRRSALPRDVAMRLAREEYARVVRQWRSLPADAWGTPTCNTGWDVADLARHVVGMTHFAASMREQLSQMRVAKRGPGVFVDNLTAEQVKRHAAKGPTELIAAMDKLGPKAAAARRRLPGLVRSRVLGEEQPVSPTECELWTIGYLTDTILTRDPWTHRSDLARACNLDLELTPEHDGVIVADIVQDWATRHDAPYELVLTGPAGGRWSRGQSGERIEIDAIEFCRILSGRGAGDGLLTVRVPF